MDYLHIICSIAIIDPSYMHTMIYKKIYLTFRTMVWYADSGMEIHIINNYVMPVFMFYTVIVEGL